MKTTKNIIQRNLPLNQHYQLIRTNYVPLLDGCGTCCDNCNKLIANMATVKADDGKYYTIGLDCMETFLINNALLDGKSIQHYNEVVKKSIPKIKEVREYLKDFLARNSFIDTVKIEVSFNYFKWITFEFFAGGRQKWNDGFKFKNMDVDMLQASLDTIKTGAKIEIVTKY